MGDRFTRFVVAVGLVVCALFIAVLGMDDNVAVIIRGLRWFGACGFVFLSLRFWRGVIKNTPIIT